MSVTGDCFKSEGPASRGYQEPDLTRENSAICMCQRALGYTALWRKSRGMLQSSHFRPVCMKAYPGTWAALGRKHKLLTLLVSGEVVKWEAWGQRVAWLFYCAF